MNQADLARAYLIARRHNPTGPVKVWIVRDAEGNAVDFGPPADWSPGTAKKVLKRECKLEEVTYDTVHVPETNDPYPWKHEDTM